MIAGGWQRSALWGFVVVGRVDDGVRYIDIVELGSEVLALLGLILVLNFSIAWEGGCGSG